jgi:pseudouridine-5'-phosphate glycosidase
MVVVSEEVKTAKAAVALESTLVAHGLPWPDNLEVARAMEAAVRARGAVPATIAIVGGKLTVGLDGVTLEKIAREGPRWRKAGIADFGPMAAAGADGATTVSSTTFAAARAGLKLFATGGIGGVHRGAAYDVSSDLMTLSREPVAVVSAGAKAILDLPRTLELLETLAVPVIGVRTNEFPAFYTRSSGLPLEHRVESAAECARVVDAHFRFRPTGILIANPIPPEHALDPALVASAIAEALHQVENNQVRGKALTPHLLAHLARATAGKSLAANRTLAIHNAAFAADVAVALAG